MYMYYMNKQHGKSYREVFINVDGPALETPICTEYIELPIPIVIKINTCIVANCTSCRVISTIHVCRFIILKCFTLTLHANEHIPNGHSTTFTIN